MDSNEFLDDPFISEIIKQMTPKTLAMQIGEIVECEEMFSEKYWISQPPQTRQYGIGHLISRLSECELIPFEFYDVSRKSRHNQYIRIEIKPNHLIQKYKDNTGEQNANSKTDA